MKYKMLLVSSPKGEFIFTSVKEVAQFLGITHQSVYNALNKKHRLRHGVVIKAFYFSKGMLENNIVVGIYK